MTQTVVNNPINPSSVAGKSTTTSKATDVGLTGDALHVASVGLPAGTPYTQTELALDGTIEQLTFNPPIKACVINVAFGEGSAALNNDEQALICFDAPNSAVATQWLTETNVAPRIAMKPSDPPRAIYFNGATVTDIWLIGKGTTPDMDVTVEGIV